MSEEILKALAQLYAIVTKQDGGATTIERTYVINSFKKKLNLDTVKEYVALFDSFVGYEEQKPDAVDTMVKTEKLTSVKDSVKTLVICKKINKTLTQKQKVIVITELLEMVKSNRNLTPQRMAIIHTVADAFNIEKEEYQALENFVLKDDANDFSDTNVLVVDSLYHVHAQNPYQTKYLYAEYLDGTIIFLKIKSVDMVFMRYHGAHEMLLNGMPVGSGDVLLFSPGSNMKSAKGSSFYYSDIVSNFLTRSKESNLVFSVVDVEYRFPNNAIGLRDITISEGSGQLIGIMGASGAGKTTLLNVMAGIEAPYKGEVLLNGINVHRDKQKIQGAFGYVAQDDLLIEELSVFDNLYFNAKLCFSALTDAEIIARVDKVLANLGLLHIRSLEVGNPMNKKISGGQRKRLNIALELIREPSVLFVDEPTSGLSSRDSENVIDLLKELSLKGTLIFVVIHQPSSDIYKMFDKMYLLDTGGYFIFNGHPVDAITYFKRLSLQADSEHGQCNTCGNVNVEQLFNIIEEKVVDEYGNFTSNRKITPTHWNGFFKNNFQKKILEVAKDAAPKILELPSKLTQFIIYTTRDLKAKWSNKQYMLINLLEAAVLSLILSVIIRYNNSPSGEYSYRYNDNIPAYLLMSIVVALFIGLSISAEEIIRDKKILKRESLLNLSRMSYLCSKIAILFSFSAFQAFTFVVVGNTILEIKSMTWEYWLILWSVSCMANVLGLLISSAFNTAVTVYIMIPLLLIPQMILSGAMFSFDKINTLIGSKKDTPLLADVMTSRWAFEALAVRQFKGNKYEENFFKAEQVANIADFNLVYLLPELGERAKYILTNKLSNSEEIKNTCLTNLETIKNELIKQKFIYPELEESYYRNLQLPKFTAGDLEKILATISLLEDTYKNIFNDANKRKDAIALSLESANPKDAAKLKNDYYNESLADLVMNADSKKKFVVDKYEIYPKTNSIYFNPLHGGSKFNYRSHFFAPTKHFAGLYIDTFIFNLIVLWIMTIMLFALLYFDVLRKIMELSLKKKNQIS